VRLALAKKELRDLRPFLALSLLFAGTDLFETLLEQVDQNDLTSEGGVVKNSYLVFQLLLAFAIGIGMLVREQDDGTLTFLDGLPITRTEIFLTKLWTALVVLMVYPTLQMALGIGLHLLSRDSLTHPLHPNLLLIAWSLHVLAALVGLSVGTMLGYLRNLAWAAAALLALALRLSSRAMPRVLLVDPTELIETPFVGDHWPLSLEAIGAQLAFSGFFLLIAWRLFAGGSARLSRLSEAMKRPLLSALAALVTMGALLGVIVVWGKDSADEAPETKNAEIAGADFGARPLSHLATKHYTFAFEGESGSVQAASKRADAIFEEIAKDLPSRHTDPIDVDLTGSMDNTGGTAFWNRIRIARTTNDLVGVLAHETTHVLAGRIVDEDGRAELDEMSMFNEGLAEWTAYRYGESERESDRLLAAVVFARREVAIEDLFTFGRFTQKYDRSLVYPLGSAFIEALVQRYGADAPAKILQTIGNKDFPPGVTGHALYQAAFQVAGFDLSLVVDDFWKLLAVWGKERKAAVDAVPRLRGIVEAGATALDLRVAADKPLPEGWTTLVRFRPTSTSSLEHYEAHPTRDQRVRRKRRNIAQDTVCFQPGMESGKRTIYEPWQCVSVQWEADDAALPE
jgi:hypothetical protein